MKNTNEAKNQMIKLYESVINGNKKLDLNVSNILRTLLSESHPNIFTDQNDISQNEYWNYQFSKITNWNNY